MPALIIRRSLLAALLFTGISCEGVTGPDVDNHSDGFTLLIERRNAAGQRSFYMMSGSGDYFAPFTAVPSDARTLVPSPDGRTIAYLRDIDGYVELWAMDRDGSNRRPILAGTFFVESAAWSPDGKKIAVAFSTETWTTDIAVMNADGTGFVNLTPDAGSAVLFDRDPAWSPDGTRIAFSSNRSGTRRLWLMNADGADMRQVLPASIAGTERNPVWAPDTTNFIAVVATNSTGPGITFVRADGTDYKHIVISPAPNDPVWLPDGRLAYIANPTGDYDIWTVDRVSGQTSQITTRRDHDVRAAVLTDVAPYAWLGLAAPVSYSINRPIAVDMAVGDVLTDGYPDLLILSPLLNELKLMRGTATGTVQNVGSLFAESDISSIRSAHVTNDAAADIVGLGDSAVYVWRGRVDGPGIATRIALNGEARGFALADLDGDGASDIVTIVQNGTQPFRVKTHTVNPSDDFVFAVDMATSRANGQSLCAGEFNNDGRTDIAILAGSPNLSAFLSTGRGELGVNDPVPAGTSLSSDLQARPYCADFNNDGRDDLALLSIGASSSVAIHKFGISSFGSATRIGATATSMTIADIDRDGDLDIIMASTNAASLLVAKNRGTGAFDTPTEIALPNTPTVVVSGDFNRDNWPDIAVIDVTGALQVLLSRGRTGM
jgi:Tol biopolymer transport system component